MLMSRGKSSAAVSACVFFFVEFHLGLLTANLKRMSGDRKRQICRVVRAATCEVESKKERRRI